MGPGTRDWNRRNLRKNGGRLTGAPCGEEPPRVRKSRQSLAGVAGSVHHRPDVGLCPLTGGGEKGKTVLGSEKRGTQEGNIFLGQQWRRVPGSVDRGGHGVDTRPWAAEPWAEVGEHQAAAQKTGEQHPLLRTCGGANVGGGILRKYGLPANEGVAESTIFGVWP